MKKLVICLALATVAVSCKKIQAGGNKNIIKLEEGTERYSDDVKGTYVEAPAANVAESAVAQDSVRTADVKEVQITADSTKTAVK